MNTSVDRFVCPDFRKKAVSERVKARIIYHLANVTSDTMLGLAFRRFAKESTRKTDEDFRELLFTIHTQIKEDPLTSRKVLGIHYRFFRNMFH